MRSPAVSPLAQIEWTIGDLDAPRELFAELFGVRPIEEAFSAALAGPHMEIEHLGLGQTVLQLCRPLIDATGHWHALAEKGPHVYNLTYFVDDMSVVLKRCAAVNIENEWHFPLGDIYKRIIPEENLSGSLEAAMLATRERVGFNLEIAETFWANEPDPRLLYPAYHPDWPSQAERTGPLELINVMTPDIAGAIETLAAIFGDALVTLLPITLNSPEQLMEAVVELGRVRIHYLQEATPATDSAISAVQSLALPVTDIAAIEAAAAKRGLSIEPCGNNLYEPMQPGIESTKRICTRNVLGIDLVVRSVESDP